MDDTLALTQPLVLELNGELATAVVYELAKNAALSARRAAAAAAKAIKDAD